eukprot:gene20462-22478_t
MGCGASKVSPSVQTVDDFNKPTSSVPSSSSTAKLVASRRESNSTKLPSISPKKSTERTASNGSIKAKPSSPTSLPSVSQNRPGSGSGNLAKRDSQLSQTRVDIFAAKPPLGANPLKPKPLSFIVPLEPSTLASKPFMPPRRLESLSNPPKILSERDLEEKMKLKEEKRQLELERKKLKSSRMSRRKRDLIAARELSKQQEQADEIKTKMQSTDEKRERLQAERVEKQRRLEERARKVREKAKRIKAGEEIDEGLGGEMETYKGNSDDGVEDHWIADNNTDIIKKPHSSKSKSSRISIDTVDSGVDKLRNEVDHFYNA